MELIENMAASDHVILRDKTHIPTKRSLVELSSQDALLAQNKLLSKKLEALTETLSKLPKYFNVNQSSHSTILQAGGCNICGGAHESSCCIPIDDSAQEVNYIGRNQPRQGYNVGKYSSFQHGSNFNQQQGQWRSHPDNQFNKEQGGPSNRPQQQGPSLYEKTTKLEETLAQFVQVSMSNHKSTKSAIKNLEIQVGQLAKQIAKKSSSTFGVNTGQNPKEECKVVMTRGRMTTIFEDEERTTEDNQELVVVEEEEDKKEIEGNQLREDKINENEKEKEREEKNKNEKEINVEEKEEKQKQKQKNEKKRVRKRRREKLRVS